MRRPAAGWRQRREAFDITSRFAPVYRAAQGGRRVLPADAEQYVYLLVPGAYGNQVPGYFKSVHKHLAGKGLDVHRSQIDTLADVASNARVLRDEILALAHPPTGPPRQVVLITHSKGGADALVADAEYQDLHGEIRAMLLMQPAYDQGTPLAALSNNPLSRAMLRRMGGKDGLLHDLAPAARRDFSASRPRRTGVPTLVLATSAKNARTSVLRPMRAVLRLLGHGESDGMIPQESQLVEGAHAVMLDDVDHAGPVLKLPGAAYEPGVLVESLLGLTLRLPRR
ncbi:MAG TPA: hypothetical protein VMZ28_07180 [Kofleriaceae bacterium]|nr:hypothetical protein [Kofleriaceae bacterium]